MRILLLHDVDGWSFHNISRSIRAASNTLEPGRHDFRVLNRGQWAGNPEVLLEALAWSQVQVFFWRFDLAVAAELLDGTAAQRARLIAILTERITVTLVYDHIYHAVADLAEFGDPFAISDLCAVSSPKLMEVYTQADHLPTPDLVLRDGVDLQKFAPAARPDFTTHPLRIGWVGKSNWGSSLSPNIKGFESIFQPALQIVADRGLRFETRIADPLTSPVASNQMPAFYADVDILVCTSAMEGTPNPVLEAMAMGKIVISTDVGVVRCVLGPIQQQMILPRNPQAFADAICRLAGDPDLMQQMAQESLERRKALSWENRYQEWQSLFSLAEQRLGDQERRDRKAQALTAFLNRRRSVLSRVRRFIFMRPRLYRVYMRLLASQPRTIKVMRGILRRV